MKKVVVGMSGGVDSSVAALLLQQQGYQVIGAMMKLSDPLPSETVKRATCCSLEDASDARRVCAQLNIPFYVFNTKAEFQKEVIASFVEEYLNGKTPNPCVRCNDKIKFEYFYKKARELGADFIATGHYVRKIWDETQQSWKLLKALDLQKDQSYFLFTITQEELAHTIFPVGHLTKSEVRAIAEQHGLKTSNKAESQEICFVPNQEHGSFIDRYQGEPKSTKGFFVDESGKPLGEHQGIHYYTVGQRRGTHVAAGEKLYVKLIDVASKNIILAKDESLYTNYLTATDVRWLKPCISGTTVTAKIRYGHEGSIAQLEFQSPEQLRVVFDKPQRAITAGQVVVFYQGEELVGGGWIL